MLDARAATLASLRARIDSLAGAGGQVPRRPPPALQARWRRVETLGFDEGGDSGRPTWVRRTAVDLSPAWDRAGICGAAPLEALLELIGHPVDHDAVSGAASEGVGVLDIETLGLHGSGVMAFLVGLGIHRGHRLDVEQYLLVDPSHEASMLESIGARIGAHPFWLSYNGRAFDVPVLAARCIVNRLAAESMHPRVHADLLGPVRRLFGERLGACTLRHAEMSLLAFHRDGDTPGSEAPARYRAWLRGAAPSVLQGVVEHNLLDLTSTVVLASRVAAHVSGERVRPAHAADGYHLARHLVRCGVADLAELELREVVAAGVDPWARRAAHQLASCVQHDRPDEALAIWQELSEADPRDLPAARACAIRLERQGDPEGALRVCVRVRRERERLGEAWWRRLRGAGDAGAIDWERRESRLRRRLENARRS